MPSMLRNGGGTWGFPCCGQQHHTTTVSRGGGASRPSEAAHSHSRLPPNGHRPMHTMHNMSIAAKSSCRLCCTIASLAWTRTQWYVLLRARIRRHTAAGRSLWAHRPRQRPRNTTRPVQSTPPPSTAGRFFFSRRRGTRRREAPDPVALGDALQGSLSAWGPVGCCSAKSWPKSKRATKTGPQLDPEARPRKRGNLRFQRNTRR